MVKTLIAPALLTLALSGCSTVALINSTHEDELQKLFAGQPRADVLKHVGNPARTRQLANGWSEDQHELRVRDDSSSTMAVVDVLTLGVFSMADSLSGRPREPIYRLSVLYDQDAKLVCARAARMSRENHAFPLTLGKGADLAGRCPG